jgi:hypothetical protein
MTCDWIMQYGIENISTIVTNVLHVGHFLEKLQNIKDLGHNVPQFWECILGLSCNFRGQIQSIL